MIDYFRNLQEVLEVVYLGGNKRVLVFKYEWFKVDNANGLQVDKESRIEEVAERHHVEEVYQEEEPHVNMPVDSNLNQPFLTRGSIPLEVVDASTDYDDSTDDKLIDDDDDDIDSTKSLSSSHEESPLDDCSDSE
ncbi:hypothetical protein Tco_1414080 [Tanacetum coccineum]